MKIFSQLDEKTREHAVHFAQHEVIDSFIANGVEAEPTTEEDKAEFQKIADALQHANTLEEYEDKIEYLFENEAVWDLSFSLALDMAQSAYYHEADETVFYLDAISECFDDEEEVKSDTLNDKDKDEEKMADIIPFPSKKPANTLN